MSDMSNDDKERELGRAVLREREAQTTIDCLKQKLARWSKLLDRIQFLLKYAGSRASSQIYLYEQLPPSLQDNAIPGDEGDCPFFSVTAGQASRIVYPSYDEIAEALRDLAEATAELEDCQRILGRKT